MDMKRLNDTLEYIEANILTETDFERIEQISCLSRYNFQKIFSILAGVSLGEYIRKRRLSHSVYLLKETDMKIIDIAYHIGYESSDAFSSSFKKLYGYTPRHLRNNHNLFPTFPKLTISLEIQGGYQMNYRVEELDTVHVAGESRDFKTMEEAQREIQDFWNEINSSGKSDQLIEYADGRLPGMLGICFPKEDGGMKYAIAVTSAQNNHSFENFTVDDGKYLVFDAVGPVPTELQKVTQEIFQNFLPSSDYQMRDAPEFELYTPGDITSNNYKVEIWIPVE